jgi:hypothetical protein
MMRPLLCAGILFLARLPMQPADKSEPNTLTPKEAAEGWVLLFDGKTTFGWNIEGAAKISGETLRLGGEKETTADFTTAFGDFELQFEYQASEVAQATFQQPESKRKFTIDVSASGRSAGKGWYRNITKAKYDAAKLVWSTTTEVYGPSGQGEARIKAENFAGDPLHALQPGFDVRPGGSLVLRNVKVKPLGLKPIFNGKDLTGWHEFPAKKSKFSVTPEGWINIKNGPGDLQTDGQWGDFVLQIDCFSNGKNLNSGVFFRCRPNEYQNGYEAQIHNGFLPEPGRDYTLEEYDPKTHELKVKKKVKYTATDYGTGAIYRRQPARFQVARDREWFTMTVNAHGNHFGVWVNGRQVTDWTDNRPPSDNARNGFRKAKGPISLQGHDPTTDLNFRNIRIAGLSDGKE